MRMRRPMRWNTASPSSSSSSRIWRLIADWETWSFSPAAVNDPVSAMARMISSCRRSMDETGSYPVRMDSARSMSSPGRAGWRLQDRLRPGDRFLQIPLVHLDADEADPELGAGDRGRAKPHEGIGHRADPIQSVQPQAHLRQPRREGGRVRPILLAVLDGFVRDEPGV